MSGHLTWYLARSSGIVAWGLLTLATVWGLFLSTRILQSRRRPAWLLDLHRWLGALSLVFTGVHLAALVADEYVEFGLREILLPGASEWRPGAVAWGVTALYLLVAVEVTSLAMKRIPRRWWKAVHLSSFALFLTVSFHAATAGADVSEPWYRVTSIVMIAAVMTVTLYRVLTAGAVARRGRAATASAD